MYRPKPFEFLKKISFGRIYRQKSTYNMKFYHLDEFQTQYNFKTTTILNKYWSDLPIYIFLGRMGIKCVYFF